MHVISLPKLKAFWQREPAAEGPLKAWYAEARNAQWATPAQIRSHYCTASILQHGRVVFNIGANKYRLVVQIRYWNTERNGTIFIRFVGTHAEYDEIDAQTI